MNVAFSEDPSHNVEQECSRAEWTGLGGMTLTSVDKTVTHTEQWAQHKGCSCLQRHPQYFWHGKSYRWCQKFFLNKSETWEGEKLHHCWKMFSPVSGTVALNDYVFPALWISPRSVKIYISLQKPTRWLPVLLVISPPCHASHWEGKWLTGSKANWIHWITRWKRAEVSHHRIPRSAWGSTTPRPLQPEEKEPCFLISCSEEDHLQQ